VDGVEPNHTTEKTPGNLLLVFYMIYSTVKYKNRIGVERKTYVMIYTIFNTASSAGRIFHNGSKDAGIEPRTVASNCH
jgi:hypothetical protein